MNGVQTSIPMGGLHLLTLAQQRREWLPYLGSSTDLTAPVHYHIEICAIDHKLRSDLFSCIGTLQATHLQQKLL